jgi:hypothetical protein
MALCSECMPPCACKHLDIADIVRDGDVCDYWHLRTTISDKTGPEVCRGTRKTDPASASLRYTRKYRESSSSG